MKGADCPPRDAPLLWLPFSRLHLVTTPFPYPTPVSVKSPCYVSYCEVNVPVLDGGTMMLHGLRHAPLLRRKPDILFSFVPFDGSVDGRPIVCEEL